MKYLIISLIKLYQLFSRKILPRRCKFHPTCSAYSLEAIEKYGLVKGLFKSIIRIVKCSPLTHGGYDPVR